MISSSAATASATRPAGIGTSDWVVGSTAGGCRSSPPDPAGETTEARGVSPAAVAEEVAAEAFGAINVTPAVARPTPIKVRRPVRAALDGDPSGDRSDICIPFVLSPDASMLTPAPAFDPPRSRLGWTVDDSAPAAHSVVCLTVSLWPFWNRDFYRTAVVHVLIQLSRHGGVRRGTRRGWLRRHCGRCAEVIAR